VSFGDRRGDVRVSTVPMPETRASASSPGISAPQPHEATGQR
jgi:hypothetical protein